MPQNHRTFLHLSEGSIAHLRPSLSAVCPLYFSFLSSLPPPLLALCQLNPPPFHLPPAPSSVCVNPLPPSLLSLLLLPLTPSITVPPSPSRPFPSLIDMFPFSKARSLHHICSPAPPPLPPIFHLLSFIRSYIMFPRVHLTPAIPNLASFYLFFFNHGLLAPSGHSCPCLGL